MPRAQDKNLTKPTMPPALLTGIRYARDKRAELEKLNGEATDLTRGHIAGITSALSAILEATADEVTRPATARAIVPGALVAAIALIRQRRGVLEQGAATDAAQGEIVGLTDALALLLEAVVDEQYNPASTL